MDTRENNFYRFCYRYFRHLTLLGAVLVFISGFLPWFKVMETGVTNSAYKMLIAKEVGSGNFYFLLIVVFILPVLAAILGYIIRKREAALAVTCVCILFDILFIANLPGLYLSEVENHLTIHIGAVLAIVVITLVMALYLWLYGRINLRHTVFFALSTVLTFIAYSLDMTAQYLSGTFNLLAFVLLIGSLITKLTAFGAAFVTNSEENCELMFRWDLIVSAALMMCTIIRLIIVVAKV